MNYDIKLIKNQEGKGIIELDRIEFLAKHVKAMSYGSRYISSKNNLITRNSAMKHSMDFLV